MTRDEGLRSTHTARVLPWDGSRADKCDQIGCRNEPVLHVELTARGSEYAAEADLCEEHLGAVAEQARAFLVALGLVKPSGELERNIAAATEEHM